MGRKDDVVSCVIGFSCVVYLWCTFGRLTRKQREIVGAGVYGEVTLNFEFVVFCVHTVLNYEWGPPAVRG